MINRRKIQLERLDFTQIPAVCSAPSKWSNYSKWLMMRRDVMLILLKSHNVTVLGTRSWQTRGPWPCGVRSPGAPGAMRMAQTFLFHQGTDQQEVLVCVMQARSDRLRSTCAILSVSLPLPIADLMRPKSFCQLLMKNKISLVSLSVCLSVWLICTTAKEKPQLPSFWIGVLKSEPRSGRMRLAQFECQMILFF